MDAVLTTLFQVGVMFILILFGVFCFKAGFISKRGNKQLSNLVISVVIPVLIFVSYQKKFDKMLLKGLLISLVIAIVSHILLMVFATIFVKKSNNPDWSVERFAVIYSNCAFMGIPLINGLYGTEGIFYLTAYITIFNILMWTHGVILLKGEKDMKSIMHAVRSPAIIAAVLGMIMFISQISLPKIILVPLNDIAVLNTPLAMIVSGVTIAQTDILKALKKWRIYLIASFKLLIVPIIVLLIFKPFGISEAVLNTAVIAAACPTATATIMFAYKYKKNAIYASEVFAVSTIISAVTLPLILILSNNL